MNTIQFAEYELQKYVAEMGVEVTVSLEVDGTKFDRTRIKRFDAALDDAFMIQVKDGKGSIVGTNSRAVLLGVYHFLKQQGCRFLRPGREGEYIPLIENVTDVEETWYAHMRHRGTTDTIHSCGGIDGILSFIDWLPKMMMNTYFIEMTDFYWDLQAWYCYDRNPYKKSENLSREQYDKWYGWIVEEIAKRGLIRHGAGHGFTNMVMEGITEVKRAGEIARTKDTTACQNPEVLPLINGKRELYSGTPLNTNLCFSQEKVRRTFAQKVYQYSVQHPEIDYLHVWLGDAFSNFCECEECRKLTPTDWYVKLLNDVDAEFTRHGSTQKIVFLLYFELLYPPVSERIQNEDRFTLLFCPYGRDFTRRYRDWEELDYEPVGLNKYTWDCMNMGLYLRQLRQWKEVFSGDSMVFDYNLYDIASAVDVTNLIQAPIVADDCLYLENLGLNGRIECGNNRAMTPTSLVWYAMRESLFYGRAYKNKEYFDDAFGEGNPVEGFLLSIENILPADYMLGRRKAFTEGEIEEIRAALERLRKFRQTLFDFTPRNIFYRRNCTYFAEYLDIIEFLYEVMLRKEQGVSEKELEEIKEEYRHLVFRKEAMMANYLPGYTWFVQLCKGLKNGER